MFKNFCGSVSENNYGAPVPLNNDYDSAAPTSSPHSIFDLKLLRSATTRYHKFIAQPISHSTPHLSSPPHPNLELFRKLSITSYTELQIAPYPHRPLWLPYHSYLPHTSLIKSQSFISTYKPTHLPPQLILSHFHPFSTPLLHSCHLTRNRQSALSII